MKNRVVQRSSEKQSSETTARAAVDGVNGISAAPPNYGIGFVDQPQGGAVVFLPNHAEPQRSFRQAQAVPFLEPLQMKAVSPPVQFQIDQAAPTNHTGLPDGLKSGIESLTGISLDAVNVHYNSSEPAQLNALAYTQGNDIYVAPGQERHLAHEAWHVVQQAQGRVQPTLRLNSGMSMNDESNLETEADNFGDRALTVGSHGRVAKTQQGTQSSRASWSFSDALSSFGQSIAQMVNLPKDSKGQLNEIKFKIGEGDEEKEITGETLQIELIKELSKVGERGFGYRLISLIYDPQIGFSKNDGKYPDEKHNMKPWPPEAKATIDNNFEYITALVEGTLVAAGQLDYLEENFNVINRTHAIVVDVDWYRERTQSDVGFHKDSRGTTLFVNLTYSNPEAMQGASTKLDREGQPQLEQELPLEVQKDLIGRREEYKAIKPHDEYGDLKEEEVKPYARISFSDPSIWHSTPLLRHRIEKMPAPTNSAAVKEYLRGAGYDPGIYKGILNYYDTSTPEKVKELYNVFSIEKTKKSTTNSIYTTH